MATSEEFQSLRTEIVESQKARIDLLKYKLLAIAVLGAIGLGFHRYESGNFQIEPDYVLSIIPFVCIYVDLLCWHITLRIIVIGRFLDYYNDPYENYLNLLGRDIPQKGIRYFYELEDVALHGSSIFISFLIGIYSIFYLYSTTPNYIKGGVFLVIGLLGTLLSFSLKWYYNKHIKELSKLAKQIKC
jgi:hypothetical protein